MDREQNRQIVFCDEIPFFLTVLGPMARVHDKISLA
jgi:hypothetical protein